MDSTKSDIYRERERDIVFFKAQTGSLLVGTISTYIICSSLSIIDQPNPELTKHFDWLPLYKSKTLWWSGRTKESSLIWNGKLRFLATLRTNEYLPSCRGGCDDASYVFWIHSLLWECHHMPLESDSESTLSPPYSKLGWLVQQAILWIPIVPAPKVLPAQGAWNWASGKRSPRCVTRMTPGPLQALQASQAESTRWWHSCKQKQITQTNIQSPTFTPNTSSHPLSIPSFRITFLLHLPVVLFLHYIHRPEFCDHLRFML